MGSSKEQIGEFSDVEPFNFLAVYYILFDVGLNHFIMLVDQKELFS